MNLTHAGRFALPRHTLVELPPGAWEVVATGGALWLTLDNDPRDIVLEPGQACTIDGRRRALVHALADAVLVLRPPLQAPAAGKAGPAGIAPAGAAWATA